MNKIDGIIDNFDLEMLKGQLAKYNLLAFSCRIGNHCFNEYESQDRATLKHKYLFDILWTPVLLIQNQS